VTAGSLNMIEIDLNVAFIQLRVDNAAPSCAMPCCRRLLAQESTNDFLAVLAGEAGLSLMKKALKVMQNCGNADLTPFGADAKQFLRGVRGEMSALIEANLIGHELLIDHFKGRPNVRLSAHAVIDETSESDAIDPVLKVGGGLECKRGGQMSL
jgi:hypothetical protein